jgi:carnitine O-acetyltransferase
MNMMKLIGAQIRDDGTFQHQGQLPRIPLPQLDESLVRFETWCSPLLTSDELAQTRDTIALFGATDGAGKKLHNLLADFDQQDDTDTWLDNFWPARYLGRRVPVSINANFFFLFKERQLSQIERAAELICIAVDFKQRLDDESLPVKYLRDTPLCMSEYKYLFSTTRIPGKHQDTAHTPYSIDKPGSAQANHIIVCHHGQMFRLNVVDAGNAYTQNEIKTALQDIVSASSSVSDQQTGYLTTLPRDNWATAREHLLQIDTANPECMYIIEQALFFLCLDEHIPLDRKDAADELLQGDGANRWFDKSVSLIVFADGNAGINVEHCGLDGTVVIDFVDALHDTDRIQQLSDTCDDQVTKPEVQPINFIHDDKLNTIIKHAKKDFNKLVDETSTAHFIFEQFGSNRIKSLSMSPDAFLQLAFQWAHFQSKDKIGATYESVTTRHFERGRTEAMRVVTAESQYFVACMNDYDCDDKTRIVAFREAANAHIARARDCQAGRAPEQYLWQLQMLAEEHGTSLGIDENDLSLFHSPGWLKMRDDYLSTSSAPSDNVTVFGFGATSAQCIGIAYLVRKDAIYSYLSTPTSVTNGMHQFMDKLKSSLTQLEALLAAEA